jgi:hypothetical protein
MTSRYGRLVYAVPMPRVLLNFDHYRDGWSVHVVQDDCRTRVGSRDSYFARQIAFSLVSLVV